MSSPIERYLSSRSYRWAAYLLFLGLTSLVIVEIMLRFSYQKPWYEKLVEEQAFRTMHPPLKNKWGLRDVDYAAKKPPGTKRVFILGDSFTWGTGVVDAEDTFPDVLERRLNDTVDIEGVERVEILNGGLPGSLTYQWVDLLERVSPEFQPDVIVAVFFLRDGTDTGSMDGFFKPIRDEIVVDNLANPFYKYLYSYRVIQDRFDRAAVAERYTDRIYNAYFGGPEETVEWRNAQRNLLAIRDYARARGIPYGLVVFPVLVELDSKTYPFQAVCDEVVRFAEQNDITVHNLLNDFRGGQGPEYWAAPYDQHPNERGHAVVADALGPFVRALLQRTESGNVNDSPS